MMKKLIKLLIALMCVSLIAAAIVCCGPASDGSDSSGEPTSSSSVEPDSGSNPTSESKSDSSHTHNFGTKWESDGNFHWHECECGEKADRAAHVVTALTVKTQPTKTAYLVGEKLDKTGMEIEGTCVCGKINVTDFTVEYSDGATSLKYGDTSVTIRHGNVTTTVSVTVEKTTVAKPAADTTVFTYNGSEQTYNIAASELYTVNGNKQTDAGEHTVTVVLKDKEHTAWADNSTDDLTFKFKIEKYAAAVVWTTAGEYIYKDTALAAPTAKIVGADGNDMALTVTGDELNSKGEHTFTASTDNGNYTLTNTTCTVTVKLHNEITGLEFADIAYDEEPSYDKGKLSVVHGTPVFTYATEENGEYAAWAEVTKKIGKYYVKAYIAEDDGYISVTAYTSFNVAKGNNSASIETAKQTYACNETPSITATADHGTATVKYSESEKGEFGEEITFALGKTYYAKAIVEESELYKGAESEVISFSIANHNYVDGKCTVCSKYNTMGVVYEYDSTNECYYVGDNKALDVAEITILSKYSDGTANGEKPVTYIRNKAFQNNSHIIKVILPSTVIRLDGSVFEYCENLEYVSMTGITDMAFKNLGKNGIYANETENVITNNNFIGCVKLTTVIVNKNFNLYADTIDAQQFYTAGATACADIYVDGTKAESNITCTRSSQNKLLTGVIYYKGNGTDNCEEWNFDGDGNIVSKRHNFVDEKCTDCKKYNTMGVVYEYDSTKDCYYVGDNKALKVAEITILSKYSDGTANGEKPVTYVRNNAFRKNPYVRTVVFPVSVERLDGSVFENCLNLEYVSMTGITDMAFKNLGTNGIYANETEDVITNNNFLGCVKLTAIVVNKNFNLYADTSEAQQFYTTSMTGCVDIYVDGTKAESNVNCARSSNNKLLSGVILYKGNANNCGEWNFDENGNIVGKKHSFVDGKCAVCDEIQTKGIIYTLNEEKDCYYVSAYNGSDKEVYVLSEYNGKSVKYVATSVFKEKDIIKIVLPESITSLEGSVFWDCQKLEYVSMAGITDLNYASPYGGGGRNNNFRNCFELKIVIVSTALKSEVGQFGCGAADTGNKKILDFYVCGESGAPSLDYKTADANNLCSGNVYYYSETKLEGAWHYVNGVATLW